MSEETTQESPGRKESGNAWKWQSKSKVRKKNTQNKVAPWAAKWQSCHLFVQDLTAPHQFNSPWYPWLECCDGIEATPKSITLRHTQGYHQPHQGKSLGQVSRSSIWLIILPCWVPHWSNVSSRLPQPKRNDAWFHHEGPPNPRTTQQHVCRIIAYPRLPTPNSKKQKHITCHLAHSQVSTQKIVRPRRKGEGRVKETGWSLASHLNAEESTQWYRSPWLGTPVCPSLSQ